MKTNGNIAKSALACALALALGLSSCIKEDMSNCPPPTDRNVHLTLRLADEVQTTRAASRLAAFDISGVRVWAFDPTGRVAIYAAVPHDPDGVYDIYMNLSAGTYDFVVWTGDGSAYRITSEEELMRVMSISLDHPDNVVGDDIPDLLYGTVRDRAIAAGVENDIEVEMRPNTYNINITASGMTRGGERWEVAIDADRIVHTFDNDIVTQSGALQHLRQGEADGDSFSTHIRTLNITPDRSMQLTLRNRSTGQTFFEEGLEKTIVDTYRANGQTPDFDRVYDYDIAFKFEFKPGLNEDGKLGVTITINGWQYNMTETGLG